MASPAPAQLRNELDPDGAMTRLLFEDSPEATIDWIEHYLTVPDEHGKVVPMRLYPQQKLMARDTTGRDLVIKGRQTRASSYFMAANLRAFVTGQIFGGTWVVGAQDDKTTENGFRARIRHHILKDLPSKGVHLTLAADNAQELVIEDFDNKIIFVSGEQRTMSRGFAVQRIHFSEYAHWKDSALELLGGAIPAVPADGRIIIESTPKGEQGGFYERAVASHQPGNPEWGDPQSLWAVHLYPWWLEPRYRVSDTMDGSDIVVPAQKLVELERTFKPDFREDELIHKHKLDLRQLLWRRFRKAELDMTPTPFLQEYPEDIDTCWLGVQGKFFETPDQIDHLSFYRESRQQPFRYMENLTYRGDSVPFHGPNLALWEMPDHKDTYVLGFDSAGGGIGKDADWSVAYVASVKKEKFVARLRVKAPPKLFAAMIAALATFYHEALVSGERSHQGDTVFRELVDLHYRNIYYHVDPTKKNERAQAGLYPTPANRTRLLENFKTAITTHAVTIFCSELVREMNVFTWQKFNNRLKATAIDLVGQHDDCIFAAIHTWFIIDKARTRFRNKLEEQDDQEIVIGRHGIVQRRGGDDYDQRLWLS